MRAIGLPSRLLFSLQQESLKGEISGDEKPNRTDPDRHGPLSDRYAPTVDEPQRVEERDQSEDRAGHQKERSLPHSISRIARRQDWAPWCVFMA
jgi:hypothetical protein